MTEGWGTWQEERRYPAKDGEHEIVVYKRTQKYGDDVKTKWKTARRKLPKAGFGPRVAHGPTGTPTLETRKPLG